MSDKALAEKLPQRTKRSKQQRIILGPVPNLEVHVRPDWWRAIFNSLYLKTDADVVDDQKITKTEVDVLLEILRPATEDHILDLCCGQGRHSLELGRRGFKSVEGVDRSHYLINKAKSCAKREGLSVRFKEGDARRLICPADAFDVVLILGNSFGYFETTQDDLKAVREVFRVLKPWGRLMLDLADGEYIREHFQPRSWEWIDKKRFVCRERSTSVDGQRLISRELITHTEKGVLADQFYAERLYTREGVAELLKTAGFSQITFHGTLTPDSQRNQDLGMMEQRMLVTAQVRKEWSPIRRRPKEGQRNVVVLLGDPTKPDHLKPSSVFDDDDFYTIDRLKEALRELKNHQFTYLSNHDTLIPDLTRLHGKVDFAFNLCDEGYNNDARKELHVPALLDKLDIRYSGAGPQCLAYCYDKSLARGMAKELGIPVPEACFVKPGDNTFELPLGFPVIVKPNFGDSSFGITQQSVANHLEELFEAISEMRERFHYNRPILVEEFLPGKDISVGVIGNPPASYVVLPMIREDYSALPEGLPRICGYEAKWSPDSPYWNLTSVPADLPEDTEKMLADWCLQLFERFECLDYARFDWRLDADGAPKLLEVNPNPGWCWDGHLAKMARLAGMSYGEMLDRILHAAEERLGLG
jgi:D-alanine-D-alanine ligase